MNPDNKEKTLKDGEVAVPQETLKNILERLDGAEKRAEDAELKVQGLAESISSGLETSDVPRLREKKNFEPKFKTVRLRKYPMGGEHENLGYVVGWTSRGAYQMVDKSGVSPIVVDFIDVIFLGHEKKPDGSINAESVRLLDLMNRGEQVHCKVLEEKKDPKVKPTGEEIHTTTFDPKHGLVDTGEVIDGYVAYSDITLVLQVPGIEKPVTVDAIFVN